MLKMARCFWLLSCVVAAFCASSALGQRMDFSNGGIGRREFNTDFSPLSPNILRMAPFIQDFGVVHLVLADGQHLFSEVAGILFGPPQEDDDRIPSHMTLFLNANYKVFIDKDSVKAYDKDMNLVMDSAKDGEGDADKKEDKENDSSEEKKEEENKEEEKKEEEKKDRRLKVERPPSGGAAQNVQGQGQFNPSDCTFRTGIGGSYNPCNTPAGSMMKNFMPSRGGLTPMLRSGII